VTLLSKNCEPIPGYKLRDRIGAGGYGEVWDCEAPGGLTKAIKFVFGRLDDERAARELKSLNRVKSARHPFLLSLERIEVIDGQLVIVSELAEQSLKERFEECKDGPSGGIPHEELLVYMRDTADALDYMSEKHSLQHLDVKPENLLLLGGRIKVADFGLVKELREVTASLMGGLTPLYAPPEVFDGRPSKFSDQYSLAIVYQEMLTGVLPFTGSTAAQLAAQHLSGKPRTSPLPPEQRAVIERALAKDPRRRFASCVELVDALSRPAAVTAESQPSGVSRPTAVTSKVGSASSSTKEDQNETPYCTPVANHSDELPELLSIAPLKSLGPLQSEEENTLRPTVVIGVGGFGVGVLQSLRRQLHDRFGAAEASLALKLLAIDTDQKALLNVTRGGADSLAHEETLAAPLRRPQDYRNDSSLILKSMSRRWLYNIPRSQLTEGLRPLGRLAMLDSAEEIYQRICSAIQAATSPQEVEAATATVGLPYNAAAPRVILAASICGGAGSGMAPELGYLAQKALADLGYSKGSVTGVLVYGSGRNPTARELGQANTFACLSELSHFGNSNECYPGDVSLNLPGSESPPFEQSYVVSLGDDLTDAQFAAGADNIASYLALDSITHTGPYLERCRAEAERTKDKGAPLALHTFGISIIDGVQDNLLNSLTDFVCRRLMETWRGEPGDASTITGDTRGATDELTAVRLSGGDANNNQQLVVEGQAAQFMREININLDQLINLSSTIINQQLDNDAAGFFNQLSNDTQQRYTPETFGEPLLETLVQIFGPRKKECPREDLSKSMVGRAMQASFADAAEELGSKISQWLLNFADQSPRRLFDSQHAADWCLAQLKQINEASRDATTRIEHELDGLERSFFPPPPVDPTKRPAKNAPPPVDPVPLRAKYFERRIIALALQGARAFLRMVMSGIMEAQNSLSDLQRDLKTTAGKFDQILEATHAEGQSAVVMRLRRRGDELSALLEQAYRQEKGGVLLPLLNKNQSLNTDFIEQMRLFGRSVVLTALKEASAAQSLGADGGSTSSRLHQYLQSALPQLTDCGGAKRLILATPDNGQSQAIADVIKREFGESPAIHPSAGDALLCFECHGLSLPHTAMELIQGRGDLAQLAARLRTRSDISWNPWPQPAAMAH